MLEWLAGHPVHHLVRAWLWVALIPVIVLLGWQASVFLVFLYSTYANFATDLGVYRSRKAELEAKD